MSRTACLSTLLATLLFIVPGAVLAGDASSDEDRGESNTGEAAGVEAEGVAPLEPPEKSRQLKQALKQLKKKEWALGSLSLYKVLEDPEQAWYHADVRFYLAYALEQMAMNYSALEEYNRFLMEVKPENKLIPEALKRSIALGRQMDAGWILAPGLARLDTSKLTAGEQGPAMFWVGQHWYNQGNWMLARAYLSLVTKGTQYYPEARMLEGISHIQEQDSVAAIAPLASALAAADSASAGSNVWEVTNLNLGRAYYALGNFERAIEHFEATPRNSPLWFEALYEASWSYFRLGRLSGALSHLQTVDSPFYDGVYHPDATLLRILIFYYLCKYIDGQEMLKDFTAEHKDIAKGLKTAVAKAEQDPTKLFDSLYAWKSAKKDAGLVLPEAVKQYFDTDESLTRIGNYLAGIDTEMAAIDRSRTGWERSALRKDLGQALEARKQVAKQGKGVEVLARLRSMLSVLQGHLGNAEIYKVEMLSKEKDIYDAAYRGALMEKVAKRGLDPSVPEGYRFWPFEGEYWLDELGWYEVNTINECLVIKR
ncbi:MAG: tetratricopeptide repeat protein [Myxococcota bacterium]|nr:tetratricopeptide repeat protein [Myxococcota bacterium]